jgi:hypothetical protein
LRAEILEPRALLSTTSLVANADAAVQNKSMAYQNYGLATFVVAGQDPRSDSECQTFARFDLTKVAHPVNLAILKLTSLGRESVSPNSTLRIRLLADADDGWIEGTGGTNYGDTGPITWNNRPTGQGLAITIPASQWTSGRPMSVDVTPLVKQSFNLNRIASFQIDVLSASRSKSWLYLTSRENQTIRARPTLMVSDVNQPPTLASPAYAKASVVTGTSTILSVLGADEAGESNLTYTWTTTSMPRSAPAPKFSGNGTNAAKYTTVTFGQAGTYALTAQVSDRNGQSVTSSVTVVVNQKFSRIVVTPGSVKLAPGATQLFAAAAFDQFGKAFATTPSFRWSTTRGTITAAGLLTVPNKLGNLTVTAFSGAFRGTASVTVTTASTLRLASNQSLWAGYATTANPATAFSSPTLTRPTNNRAINAYVQAIDLLVQQGY